MSNPTEDNLEQLVYEFAKDIADAFDGDYEKYRYENFEHKLVGDIKSLIKAQQTALIERIERGALTYIKGTEREIHILNEEPLVFTKQYGKFVPMSAIEAIKEELCQ